MFGLPSLYIKLIGGAVAALALLGLILGLKHYKALAESRGQSLALICQTTRTASGNPKLKCSEVPAQIKFMGEAVTVLTNGVHRQNNMIDAQAREISRQKVLADEASRGANKRAEAPKATSARLEASARSNDRLTKPCTPSPELENSWH